MPKGEKILAVIPTPPDAHEGIEAAIAALLRKEIYLPLLKILGVTSTTLKNRSNDLADAIRTGRVRYHRGHLVGSFNARLSAEIKALGARWDATTASWRITLADLPYDIRSAVSVSETRFDNMAMKIDEQLARVLPAELAEKLTTEKFFDKTIYQVDGDVRSQLSAITVTPNLSAEARRYLAEQYTKNLKTYVKDFAESEMLKLRKKVATATMAGNRFESMVDSIQSSYKVSQAKAKFLARQETNLFTAKLKEERYTAAGVMEYRWTCVAGSPDHPVRDDHKALNGKRFFFNDPPVTNTRTGARNNPGEDFNCRCVARPIVKF